VSLMPGLPSAGGWRVAGGEAPGLDLAEASCTGPGTLVNVVTGLALTLRARSRPDHPFGKGEVTSADVANGASRCGCANRRRVRSGAARVRSIVPRPAAPARTAAQGRRRKGRGLRCRLVGAAAAAPEELGAGEPGELGLHVAELGLATLDAVLVRLDVARGALQLAPRRQHLRVHGVQQVEQVRGELGHGVEQVRRQGGDGRGGSRCRDGFRGLGHPVGELDRQLDDWPGLLGEVVGRAADLPGRARRRRRRPP